LEKTEGFRQLIGHVREKVVGGLAHKDCPFPTIVQALMEHHPRDPRYAFALLLIHIATKTKMDWFWIRDCVEQRLRFSLVPRALLPMSLCSRPSVFQAMFVVQQPHQMFETGVGSLLGNDVHQPLDFGCDGVTLKTLPMERRHVLFLRPYAIQVNHYARRQQRLAVFK
jgi:hypothetical protein